MTKQRPTQMQLGADVVVIPDVFTLRQAQRRGTGCRATQRLAQQRSLQSNEVVADKMEQDHFEKCNCPFCDLCMVDFHERDQPAPALVACTTCHCTSKCCCMPLCGNGLAHSLYHTLRDSHVELDNDSVIACQIAAVAVFPTHSVTCQQKAADWPAHIGTWHTPTAIERVIC